MKCLNCGTVILKKGLQLEDGSFCLDPEQPNKIDGEGSKSFVRCHGCKAKNYLEAWPENKTSWQQDYFSHYEFD